MRRIERRRARRVAAQPTSAGERFFPHEFIYRDPARRACSKQHYQIDPKDCWLLAAAESEPADLRARLGGLDARQHLRRPLHRGRRQERAHRAHRHRVHDACSPTGITDDEPQEPRSASSRSAAASPATSRSASCRCCTRTCSSTDVPLWGYFCQISDSTTSYGSYSGAVPNEKITWGKLGVDTPKFIIESDATIVAPLIFAHVLGE